MGMDKTEALSIAEAELQSLREMSYAELVDRLLDTQETFERQGATGSSYQLELQAFWDSGPGNDLRVVVSIDDGGWRAFSPSGVDLIRAPNGSFVGE